MNLLHGRLRILQVHRKPKYSTTVQGCHQSECPIAGTNLKGVSYTRKLGHPVAVLEVEEAGDVRDAVLVHVPPRLTLCILDHGLGLRRHIHLLRDDRACQPCPQPAPGHELPERLEETGMGAPVGLVGLLLVLGRDTLRHDVLPIRDCVK